MPRSLVALVAAAMSLAAADRPVAAQAARAQAAQAPAAQSAPRPSTQGAALPTSQQVVARSIEALGGEKAFKAVKSLHAVGRMTMVGPAISGEFEQFTARPSRVLMRANIAGIGKVENGYDGKIGWSINPVSGPELLKDKQLTEASEEAWFDAPLHTRDRVRSMEVVGRVEFDGHQTYKLKVVYPSGNEQFEYFDVTTGLQAGSEASRTLPQGVVPVTNFMRDYKKFGALLQAATVVQRALGLDQVLTISSVEYDNVPDSVFDVPAQVKPLLTR